MRSSTLYQRILESIDERETRSQMQDVEKMATSSSQATISGIYGALLDMENHNPNSNAAANRRKKKRSHLSRKLVKSSTKRLSNSRSSASSQPRSSSVDSIQREISRD